MYKQSYSAAGEKLWFGDPNVLTSAYPCGLVFACRGERVVCGILFQTRHTSEENHYRVKLSLLIHNGSPDGKAQLYNRLLPALLAKPGVYIEASGAVSWIFAKEANQSNRHEE